MVFELHEKLIIRVSERNLNMAVLGKVLIAFSIGAMFSIQLVQFGFFILIASAVTLLGYLNTSFINWLRDMKVGYATHIKGFIGGFLLMGFLGIQSPFLPFKKYVLILGILLTIPAFMNILGGGKNK